MMILLVIDDAREGAPQPFMAGGSATEVWCRMRSCFIGLLHPLIVRKEPANGETELAPHLPLQLLHLRLDYQVNRFLGCDCHIEEFHKILKSGWRLAACRLQTGQRLIRYVTLCAAIAWRLYWLTHINRVAPTTPAALLLTSEEIAAL